MMKTNISLALKVAQDEYCYTMAEVEKWFERGGCGFVDVWTLFTTARALELQMEQLEVENTVDSILSEFEPESRELVDDICYRVPEGREFPAVQLPELDIDVVYDFSEMEQLEEKRVSVWP